MPSILTRSLCAAVAALTVTAPAWAAVTIVFDELGGHVVGSFSGSIDLTGFTLDAPDGFRAAIDPGAGFLGFGSGAADVHVNPSFSPIAYGSGGPTSADSSTGGGLLFSSSYLFVPQGYVSGANLVPGSSTFNSATLASLGITPGSVTFRLPNNDSITIIANATAVPEPGTLGLIAAALGGWGLVARRRQ